MEAAVAAGRCGRLCRRRVGRGRCELGAPARQDWPARRAERFFGMHAHQGGIAEREAMIDRDPALPITRQAQLLGMSRGAVYYLPRPTSAADLALMRRIGELHLEYPFMGERQQRRDTRSTRTCCASWPSHGRTRSGRWTRPTSRWRAAMCTSPWWWTWPAAGYRRTKWSNSAPLSKRPPSTHKSGKAVQTNGQLQSPTASLLQSARNFNLRSIG